MTFSHSLWQQNSPKAFPVLSSNLHTDVCVIGAGISGLTTAYFLVKSGFKVTLLDAGEIGGNETLRTTAHISNAFDDRYFNALSIHGKENAQLIAGSHTKAIECIHEIIEEEKLDCEFKYLDGYLFLGEEHTDRYLQKEFLAALSCGLKDVRYLPSCSLLSGLSTPLGACLCFPNQAQFHPGKYVLGLSARLSRKCGIFSQTQVVKIHSGKETKVETAHGHFISCDSVVVATNVPINRLVQVHDKQAAYRSYVLAFAISQENFPDILLWDTASPYHYVRKHITEEGAYLIVGGEDHRTGQLDKNKNPYESLEKWARDRFLHLKEIRFRWSGQIIESGDGVAYIGSMGGKEKNIYIATGDSGHGITHGTIAGLLISDLIQGKKNPWTALYDPSRVKLKSLPAVIRENLNTGLQYSDWILPGEATSPDQIPKGTAAILHCGTNKCAVYRDENGQLHARSAVCTHLKGILRWNDLESTWDCPCHGSRFTIDGKTVNGPAIASLCEQKTI